MHSDLSPYVVPLGAFAVGIIAIVSGALSQAHTQKLKADQRMAMVARGMNADDIDKLLSKASGDGKPMRDPMQSLATTRKTGIVLISSGSGIDSFFCGLGVDSGRARGAVGRRGRLDSAGHRGWLPDRLQVAEARPLAPGPGDRAGRMTGLRLLFGERFDKISPWPSNQIEPEQGADGTD